MPRGPAEPGLIHHALHDEHRQLDEVFEELAHAAEAGVDKRTLGEIWTRFDRKLRSHFALEEEVVFPALAHQHPDEVAALRAEHDHIRATLDALDIAVDLRFIRSREVTELVDLLRAHAATEDARLYTWAEVEIAQADRSRLLRRLGDPWLNSDHLALQAHLAQREASEPSVARSTVHEEASALAVIRDTLRVRIHLGQLDARDEWDRLEDRWRVFIQHDVNPKLTELTTDFESFAQGVLQDIRRTYQKLLDR